MLIFVTSNLNTNFSSAKTKIYRQDSLIIRVETKIDELTVAVKDLNQLIEYPTPENLSADELQNWYEQTALILGIRNVNEEYLIKFRKMLDEWNYLPYQPVVGDFIQMKMELESVLLNYISTAKKFKSITTKAEDRMENVFVILESFKN